jgi:hypothetical protein
MSAVRSRADRRRRMVCPAGFPALLGLLAWAGAVMAPPASAAVPVVTATIQVGFDPGGMTVNPVTSAVYVANSGSNTVSVIS